MASRRKRPIARVEIKVVAHPSGRAVCSPERRGLSICRDPGRGPLISRLRDPEPRDAIGFHHIRALVDDEDGPA